LKSLLNFKDPIEIPVELKDPIETPVELYVLEEVVTHVQLLQVRRVEEELGDRAAEPAPSPASSAPREGIESLGE
jgi:hypothetical protein